MACTILLSTRISKFFARLHRIQLNKGIVHVLQWRYTVDWKWMSQGYRDMKINLRFIRQPLKPINILKEYQLQEKDSRTLTFVRMK